MNLSLKVYSKAVLLIICILLFRLSYAQDQTVGLFTYDSASYEGYTLIAPNLSGTTYLIDNYGRIVHTWESEYAPGKAVYLLENGILLRSISLPEYGSEGSGAGGGFQKINWNGDVIWEYHYASDTYLQHHDIEPLPNGNVLLLAWDYRSHEEYLEAGRDPQYTNDSEVQMEKVIEVQQSSLYSGTIVWEWFIYDHLIQDFDSTKNNYGIIAEHSELIDINALNVYRKALFHGNTVTYNPDFDQIVISGNSYSEIWIIDHSTTTAEASGHTGGKSGKGGDILYRWGNPANYDAGNEDDRIFYAQHDIQWIEEDHPGAGNLLVFNNGRMRPGADYSTADEFVPPVDGMGNYSIPEPGFPFEPVDRLWSYIADPPNDLFSIAMSGVQRLPNGNTLIYSNTRGRFIEVTPENEIVWEYICPVIGSGPVDQGDNLTPSANGTFKGRRYQRDIQGFVGKKIVPGSQIELYPITFSGTRHSPFYPSSFIPITVVSEITSESPVTSAILYIDTGFGNFSVEMFDDGNHNDRNADDGIYGAQIPPVSFSSTVSYYLWANNSEGDQINDPPNAPSIRYKYVLAHCCNHDGIRGDANIDRVINIADLVFIVDFLFKGGPIPDCFEEGDTNGDGNILVDDLVLLVDYLFKGGPSPGPCPI